MTKAVAKASDGASVGDYTSSTVNSREERGRPYQRGRLRHRKTNHRKLQNITNLSTIKPYNSGSISELTSYSTDITHHGTTQEKKGKMTSKLTLLSTDTIHRGTAQEKKGRMTSELNSLSTCCAFS